MRLKKKKLDWFLVLAILMFLFFAKLVFWDYYVLIFGKVGTIKIYIFVAVVLTIATIYILKVHEPRRRKAEEALFHPKEFYLVSEV